MNDIIGITTTGEVMLILDGVNIFGSDYLTYT